MGRAERMVEAERVFTAVGLTPASEMLRKFPYEMSGGQRQRVGFAQALAAKPSLIVADEPVSMLDVSIRAGILNLMVDLREREGVSILYITHDIASARYVADRIMVMYAGHLVETGPTERVLAHPRHPYTPAPVGGAGSTRAGVRGRVSRHRRTTQGRQPVRRLSVPRAVPARHRSVLAGDAAPPDAGGRPFGCLSRGGRGGQCRAHGIFPKRSRMG